jgi:hypothetical protein
MNSTTGTVAQLSPAPDAHPHPPVRFDVPLGAVDTHAHIVGDSFVPERSYTPVPAPPRDYLAMLDATGMTYGVLIQVSVHGTDNSLLVETLRAHPERLRGIAVAPHDLSDRALGELKDAGVVWPAAQHRLRRRLGLTIWLTTRPSVRNWAGICSSHPRKPP